MSEGYTESLKQTLTTKNKRIWYDIRMLKAKYITVSRLFHFSAAHRLFREGLSAEENEKAFGKCSKVHGHDYVMKVTVRSVSEGANVDMVVNVSTLGEVVEKEVLSLVDRRNLLADVPFLAGVLPTMENIAKKIAERLEEPLQGIGAELYELTLAESEKNSVTLHFV